MAILLHGSGYSQCFKIFLIVFLLPVLVFAVDGVDLLVPLSPINEGSNVTISCTVTGLPLEDVSITRSQVDGSNSEILVINGRPVSVLPRNIAIRIADDAAGNHVFSVMVAVTRADSMTYTCAAESGLSTFEDNGQLEVYYIPDFNYPICEVSGVSSASDTIRQAGDEVIVQCISQIGNPHVDLTWSKTRKTGTVNALASRKEDKDLLTYATTIVNLKAQDDGVIFTCRLSNIEGRSCRIGPFEVTGIDSGSPNAIDTTMVVAIVILVIVIAVVSSVVVIALLIKYGCCCACGRRGQDQSDSTDGFEMRVRNGRGQQRTGLEHEMGMYREEETYSDRSLGRRSVRSNGSTYSDRSLGRRSVRSNGSLKRVEADAYSDSSLSRKSIRSSTSSASSMQDPDTYSSSSLKRNRNRNGPIPEEDYYPPPPSYPSDHPPEEPELSSIDYDGRLPSMDHVDGGIGAEKLYPDLPTESLPDSPAPSVQGMIPIDQDETHVDASVTIE